jgi:hypothetical protein
MAKSVCVQQQGCGGSPQGTIRLQPLEPKLRAALAAALLAAGFELVELDAEPDVLADVEWRGTDAILLRLQDARGRPIEQAAYARSLEHCRDLPDLTWDSCWSANFPRMKAELARPLRRSAALRAFSDRRRNLGADAAVVEVAPTRLEARSGAPAEAETGADEPGGALADGLVAAQIQETVAGYREALQRRCWLPVLEARDPSAPSSARVSTTVTIASNGSVASVTAGGDPLGYPRLSSCIVDELKQWRFPPARSTSVANVPFVFVAD